MTTNHSLKQLIRARMRITGESYTQARRNSMRTYNPTNVPLLDNLLPSNEHLIFRKENEMQGDGLHLVLGSNGSGRTTTMNSLVDYYMRMNCNARLVSIAMKQEIKMPAEFAQVNIDPFDTSYIPTGGSYSLFHPARRMRPDYISYHEIRNEADVSEALHAGLSGHTVFSTLHAPNEEYAISKMENMVSKDENEREVISAYFRECLKSLTTMNIVKVGGHRLRFATSIPMTKESWDAAHENQLTNWCSANGYESSTMKIERLLKEKVLEYGPHGLQAVVEK
jgi:Tfp pilus assembly pilus retraction ATPase PilT